MSEIGILISHKNPVIYICIVYSICNKVIRMYDLITNLNIVLESKPRYLETENNINLEMKCYAYIQLYMYNVVNDSC